MQPQSGLHMGIFCVIDVTRKAIAGYCTLLMVLTFLGWLVHHISFPNFGLKLKEN